MAKATVEIKCARCGETFIHSKECHNRKEADAYEVWAREHVDYCPACNSKRNAEAAKSRADAMLKKYDVTLPKLKGGASEKQIAFASSVRTRYIADNMGEVSQYCMAHVNLRFHREEIEAECAKQGMTIDTMMDTYYKSVPKTHLAMTCTSAREIIDALR